MFLLYALLKLVRFRYLSYTKRRDILKCCQTIHEVAAAAGSDWSKSNKSGPVNMLDASLMQTILSC